MENQFERFTGKRMERILATVIAIGSAILGAQALVAAIGGLAHGASTVQVVLLLIVYVPLAAMLLACVIGRGVRQTAGVFAIGYVVALAAWPLVNDASPYRANQPWIFFLVNVGVVAAMLAFAVWMQVILAFALPLIYGYIRLVEGDFSSAYWTSTAFDVSFTLILGIVIISLGWMFRSVAAGVDEARGQAVASYTAAAAGAAVEEERVAMAALMHDSVLAALIAAERADSDRARDLAVAMAREALTRLANTEAVVAQEGSDDPVGTAQIVAELRRALSELGADAIVEERGTAGLIPGRVARAVVLAARQAIGNALTHASGRGLHVVAEGDGDAGVSVTVIDAGPGFDLETIGEDRLGIRASIVARMAAVAGSATIDSGAAGTRVLLSWERA
ncbi:signal transduction histidine kinase [Microbacterium ginsengiterrae]|uniref:Signal transduction histidine kinase n=2 Tax=Microbacterium ginsengiterrae TaxID=546115 RepID=A0A7W9C9Z7_9MICO|nr:ATP-binding protein [Microbacterium ginsengiterrae]MBB5741788.1 signal transduction histidine kinase [Microbacterium ginsengiterrae]